MGCLIAFRLCCSRVFVLAAVFLFFFVAQGWAACENVSVAYRCSGGNASCSGCPSNWNGYGTPPRFSIHASVTGKGYCSTGGTVTISCPGVEGGGVFSLDRSTYYRYCGGSDYSASGTFYGKVCTNQCEADSLKGCPEGQHWNQAECKCEDDPPPPSSSSAPPPSSSSAPPPSSSSFDPPPDCQTRYCCDSLAQNRPVEIDTIWEGCVPTDPTQPGCIVYSESITPGDTTLGAECNGKSQYMICTKEWTWSESAKQCAQLETNNCIRFTQTDSMCSGIICYATQQHSLSSLDYNALTLCYTGTETVQSVLICNNGQREDRGYYTRPWKVCKPYLDSIGTDIGDYIAGKSGYSGSGYSPGGSGGGTGGGTGGGSGGGTGGGTGGGSGGGTGGGTGGGSGGGDPNYGGCVGNGCGGSDGMAAGYGGGTSLDGEGNEVDNSPSPGMGGNWSYTPQIVTTTDSSGNVQIVKNSQGGDSIQVVSTWNQLKCLGVSNGYATLTNGLNTWTCEAMSCSQATLSASINGGACSAGANGVGPSETNPSLPTINYGSSTSTAIDWNQNEYQLLEQGLSMITATLNGNHNSRTRHDDSISAARDRYWKITFGNDLSYVDSIRSKMGQNVAATEGVATAVGSASQSISTAVGNAASTVSGAVASGASDVRTAVSNVRTAVNDLNTTVGNFKDTYVVKTTDINSSIVDVGTQVQQTRTTVRDTVHNTNQILERIEGAVADTGRNVTETVKDIDKSVSSIPASIWSVDSNISSLAIKVDSFSKVNLENWSNDKLVMIIDTNVQKVADAIDSLKLEVSLDSVSVIVEHDTILDSIDARLQVRSSQSMQFVEDTLDLASVYSQAFNEAKVDSNIVLDSSVVEDMRSRSYVSGSDVVDPTNVDSVSSVLNSKLDSSKAHYNARSDSMTRSLVDSTLKYSGIDSGGAALRRFFDVPDNGCPRQCLDITLQIPQNLGGGETKIKFSEIVCDKKIIGNYGVLDFVKLVLRILTAYLSLMFIWNAMWYLNTGAKKK